MRDDELREARRDLAVGLSLLRPGSAMFGPAHAHLGLIDAELAQRHRAGQKDSLRQQAEHRPPAAEGRPGT